MTSELISDDANFAEFLTVVRAAQQQRIEDAAQAGFVRDQAAIEAAGYPAILGEKTLRFSQRLANITKPGVRERIGRAFKSPTDLEAVARSLRHWRKAETSLLFPSEPVPINDGTFVHGWILETGVPVNNGKDDGVPYDLSIAEVAVEQTTGMKWDLNRTVVGVNQDLPGSTPVSVYDRTNKSGVYPAESHQELPDSTYLGLIAAINVFDRLPNEILTGRNR